MNTTPFRQWAPAERFNRFCSKTDCRYVILLTKTHSFDIEKDLKYTLRITKKPMYWFLEKFKEYGIRIEYATVYCQKDIRYFGPVSNAVSDGIVKEYLLSKYSTSTTTLVCPPGFAKRFLPFESIHPETVVHRLVGR